MKVVEDQSTAGSWVTIITLIALGVVGYLAYQHRDRFFPPDEPATPAPLKVSDEVQTKFFEARDQIVSGKYDEASSILTSIDTDQVPQPTRNWITMQNGLSRLLAGQLPEARAEFAKVQKRGPFTKDPRKEQLVKFFVNAAHLAASEEPQKKELANDYDPETTESFALLIFGLKDWLLGEFEDATALLHDFKLATPPDSEIWLRRYQAIGDAYVESYVAFQAGTEAAKGVEGSQELKERALATIGDALEKVKNQPALFAKLSAIRTELKSQVDAVNTEMQKKVDDAEAADQKIIDDVKSRVALFNEKLQFADGHQIVFTSTVDGEKAKAELDRMFKRTEWLGKFKNTLADDINAAGYLKPLKKKDGSAIATGVKSADDSQLLTPTKAPVQWTDLATDTIVSMAKDFIASTKAPEAAADRKWLLGNFLYQLGKKPEALTLMHEAAATKTAYKDSLPLFPEDAEK